MKVRIKTDLGGMNIDETLTGDNENELFRAFRHLVQSHKHILGLLSDHKFISEVVEKYNEMAHANEPVPDDISGFFTFARKTGVLTDE